jgi:hypothetical protein
MEISVRRLLSQNKRRSRSRGIVVRNEASFFKESTIFDSDQDFSEEEENAKDKAEEQLRCPLALSLTIEVYIPGCL